MKVVVFGPHKRTGILHDGSVVDVSGAVAKRLAERNNERDPIRLADADGRRQHINAGAMVFSYGEYLEHLSRDFTFYPGDMISGGTGAGTAADSSPTMADGKPGPERFLKPGDVVEIRSPAIGTLRSYINADDAVQH